jgi:NADPH2:quinone reductase
MKAVQIPDHGSTDQITVNDVSEPEPGRGDVLLDVQAAALNHLDLWVLGGLPGVELDFPHTLGSDACGIVRETGPDVSRFEEGDRVVINAGMSCGSCEQCRRGEQSCCDSFYLLGEHVDGTFAEQVTVPEENCAMAPGHLEDTEAAAFPLVFLTAWRMLHTRVGLESGDTVLIHGIGGGVSSAALTLATAADARCIVTSGSEDKLDRASELGASNGIHYEQESVTDRVRSITNGRGVDVVVDNVGQETWEESVSCARTGGSIVTCGATTGPAAETNIHQLYWKQLNIYGSTMGSHDDFRRMMRWVRQTKMEPIIDRVYPLDEARKAEERLQEGQQFGKIVLEI